MKEQFDVAIVGGGFSGLGLAREAAFNGFRTILLEARTPGCSTSANSLRIVHGGFRYLQTGALDRVVRSARALKDLLQKYPALIRPLSCLMPLQGFGTKSRIPVLGALSLYHLLTSTPAKRKGSVLSAAEAEAAAPALKGMVKHGALQWWDGLVLDPAGLIQRVVDDAAQLGAEIRSGAEVTSAHLESSKVRLRIKQPEETEITARVVVNASGPAISSIEVPGAARSAIGWCKGFNLVFRSQLHPAIAIAGQGRGRLLFAVPRDTGTAIGTWYVPADSAPGNTVHGDQIASALEDIRAAYPGFSADRSELQTVEAGLLPTNQSKNGAPVPLSRELLITSGRYSELVSTKFTTYEIQAANLLRSLAPLLQ